MKRRNFNKTMVGGAGSALMARALAARSDNDQARPNVIFLNVDQLAYNRLSCMGVSDLSTPAIDALSKRSMVFTQAFSAVPICGPARHSWYYSRHGVEHGTVNNGMGTPEPIFPTIQQVFRDGGYQTAHFGKWHFSGKMEEQFDIAAGTCFGGEMADSPVADVFSTFLNTREDKRPFYCDIALVNPHDICYVNGVCRRTLHGANIDSFLSSIGEDRLPELPKNHACIPSPEPDAVTKAYRANNLYGQFTEKEKQVQLYLYDRYVEMVDDVIGQVLNTLENSPYNRNTVILFTSDHGEGHGELGLYNKYYLYDSAVRIPFMVSIPGATTNGMNTDALVSHLDIFPTLADYANLKVPDSIRGKSLKAVLDGKSKTHHESIYAEAQLIGRMIRTREYKYIEYRNDGNVQLFDCFKDPLEMKNIAFEKPDETEKMRGLLYAYEEKLTPAPQSKKRKKK